MKPYKTYQEQMKILTKRGLLIDDESFALKILEQENYYNLINGYKDFFLEDNAQKEERFKKGTKFEEVYALYSFDRELRNILLEYLLKFETHIKSRVAHRFSEKNTEVYSYLDVKNYAYETDLKAILTLVTTLCNVIKKTANQKSIRHYLDHHNDVPLWVLVNFLTIGNIQYFYSCLQTSLKNRIAKDFALAFKKDYNKSIILKVETLESILKTINFFRNVCAHEERLYNFHLYKPTSSSQVEELLNINHAYLKKGNVFTVTAFLKLVISKGDYEAFIGKIDELFVRYSLEISSANFEEILKEMGFDSNWKKILLEIY